MEWWWIFPILCLICVLVMLLRGGRGCGCMGMTGRTRGDGERKEKGS